jgi:ABC-type phosphate/phosphonate transport system substrate-binding protein
MFRMNHKAKNMTEKKIFMAQTMILGAFLILPATRAFAATGEMGNGFGRNGERPPMTVDGCVQKTGKTATECQTIIDSFTERTRTRTADGGEKDGSQRRDGQSQNTDRPGRFGIDSTDRFAMMKTRLDKVVAFLKSKGADTAVLEDDYAVLKEKMTVAEADFATLRDAKSVWRADQSTANQTALDTARAAAQASSGAVKTYYHDTLLPILKSLLQAIA